MFKSYCSRSNYIELISEETDDSGTQHKVLFRVTNQSAWSTALVDLLRFAEDEEDYLVSVRKEYLLKDGSPTFMWVLIVYGNLDAAATDLGPFLCARIQTPARPSTTAIVEEPPPAPTQTYIKERRIMTDDGVRVIKEVPLAFRRGARDRPSAGTVKRFGDSRKGAFVTVAAGVES
jgi:hypothetical protein